MITRRLTIIMTACLCIVAAIFWGRDNVGHHNNLLSIDYEAQRITKDQYEEFSNSCIKTVLLAKAGADQQHYDYLIKFPGGGSQYFIKLPNVDYSFGFSESIGNAAVIARAILKSNKDSTLLLLEFSDGYFKLIKPV